MSRVAMAARNANRRSTRGGFTIIEILASLAIAGLLMASMQQLLRESNQLRVANQIANQAQQHLHFALSRMQRHAAHSSRLLLPSNDRPMTTTISEHQRFETVPPSSTMTAVLALALPVAIDRDGNGVPDADNDGDGRVNEDSSGDINNDGKNGFAGIDDDADGLIDENFLGADTDDDEMLNLSDEDPLNGTDDDGDGSIDEDWSQDQNNDGMPGIAGKDDDNDGLVDEGHYGDDDEDGIRDEDWVDYVLYFVRDDQIIERISVPWDANGDARIDGRDYLEAPLINRVQAFRVERIANITTSLPLLELSIETLDEQGNAHSLNLRLRVGGAA